MILWYYDIVYVFLLSIYIITNVTETDSDLVKKYTQ